MELISEMWNYEGLRQNYFKILKIAIGTTFAILVAEIIGLQFSSSAGIITLLSIQDTRKDTIKIAGKRLVSFLVAVTSAYLCFGLFGYEVYVFGLFLLLFVSLSYLFGLLDGVAMNSVLTTHFLSNQIMDGPSIANEMGIFLIGVTVGIAINLFMLPEEAYIRKDMRQIEEDMKKIFLEMASMLRFEGKKKEAPAIFSPLKELIVEALKKAQTNQKNALFSDTSYYADYILMRKQQLTILQRVYYQIERLTDLTEQASTLARFFEDLADSFHEYNNSEALLVYLDAMLMKYELEELPKTRVEFENRALLYASIRDMEIFLQAKREFVVSLTEDEIRRYWNEEK